MEFDGASEMSALPLPTGTSCTPGKRLSTFAGLTTMTAWLPYEEISAGAMARPGARFG